MHARAIAGSRHIGSLSTGLSALSQPFKLRLSRGTGDDALLRDYSAQACAMRRHASLVEDNICSRVDTAAMYACSLVLVLGRLTTWCIEI